jgi:hypothetical protein
MKRFHAHSVTDFGKSITSFARPSGSQSSWTMAAMPGQPHLHLAVSQPGNSITSSSV